MRGVEHLSHALQTSVCLGFTSRTLGLLVEFLSPDSWEREVQALVSQAV